MSHPRIHLIALFALLVVTLTLFSSAPAFAQVPDPTNSTSSTGPGTESSTSPAAGLDADSEENPEAEPVAGAGAGAGAGEGAGAGDASQGGPEISLDLGGALDRPSQSITVILLLTVLSVAPALLMMLTSFTRIVIVLSLTRNALGLQSIPPNQVIVGLALFLSLFVMSPVLGEMNAKALQPFLRGEISQQVALDHAEEPLREFMLDQTRKPELAMFIDASDRPRPATPAEVPLTSLVPAFILSELKTAFIIGFIVFVPFLIIDLLVSSSLMSMGMMMMPPVMVSLPFKILLFVLVDGWALVTRSLLASFG